MSNLRDSVKEFFSLLDIGSDRDKLHFYKEYIASAASEFLDGETKEKAFDVYSFFLDSYRINISGDRSFIDLLDILRRYEENAALLSDKQRDHYIHSVNVFLLGLGIYAKSANFRMSFREYLDTGEKKERVFDTLHEEFFFRWGIAALFHDIGYPVEIVNNQINKYIGFVSGSDNKGRADAGPFLDYFDFSKINSINAFKEEYYEIPEYIIASGAGGGTDVSKPSGILACNIINSLVLDSNEVYSKVNDFLLTMQKHKFVDHGYYSALIVLKWYGELTQKKYGKDKLLYSYILDSAASIFLHNAYRNVFMREPFNLGKLEANLQPIAYLLILCDEAQEWNREAYGEKTRQLILVDSSKVDITPRQLDLHYITKKGVLNENFADDKAAFINKILDINRVFEDNIRITATTLSEKFIKDIATSRPNKFPRIMIEYIELIAVKIHEKYNETQKIRKPNSEVKFPTWESLPETLKYSNIRQARDIAMKLELINCYLAQDSLHDQVMDFSKDEIEYLAKVEHNHWVAERRNTGWSYDIKKDVAEKKTPYLVEYEDLPEDIKELDRDTARNIINLVSEVGLKVYRINNKTRTNNSQ